MVPVLPRTDSNPERVSLAPEISGWPVSIPLVMITREVRVQITSVSMNTSNMPYIPWRQG